MLDSELAKRTADKIARGVEEAINAALDSRIQIRSEIVDTTAGFTDTTTWRVEVPFIPLTPENIQKLNMIDDRWARVLDIKQVYGLASMANEILRAHPDEASRYQRDSLAHELAKNMIEVMGDLPLPPSIRR